VQHHREVRQLDGAVCLSRWVPFLLALWAVCAAAAAHGALPMIACHDPCLGAARGAYRQCNSSASGAFQDALDGCIERAHECVNACRTRQQDCRDSAGTDAALAACAATLAMEQQRCEETFPPTPPASAHLRAKCIDKAQLANFRCGNKARRSSRRAVRGCRRGFRQCIDSCGPGGPPGGSKVCRDQGKTAFRAVLADCKLTFQVTSSACINRDVTCVQGCADARLTCEAPTRSMLGAALAACTADQANAIAACRAMNPPDSSALDSCITAAQANAAVCRDAALNAAAPGLAACVQPYVACVRACPPPP